MNQGRLMNIILSPHISEKSTRLADKHHQFVFKVVRDATKEEIKKAVELIFNVQVSAVQTASIEGKKKVFRMVRGRHRHWKKAYVILKSGDINFATQVQ